MADEAYVIWKCEHFPLKFDQLPHGVSESAIANSLNISISLDRNIQGHKAMLCIWWDMKGVVYNKLLRLNETIIAELERLNYNLM